jgi:hypothetical protein
MFRLGHNQVKDFTIFISSQLSIENDFYDILVIEKDYYINLHSDKRFPFIEFKFPPKPLSIKVKKNKLGEEVEEVETETEQQYIYRREHYYYDIRKSMQMPMWRLHKMTLEKLFEEMGK